MLSGTASALLPSSPSRAAERAPKNPRRENSLAMMAFWILEISTIIFIVYSFEYFLGGQMFPVDIMPIGVQAVMKWLPFYYELFCPIAIFLGRLRGAELVQALAIQSCWLIVTWAVAQVMWKRGLGHYQAVGG